MRGFGTINLSPAMLLKPFIETVYRTVVYEQHLLLCRTDI